MEEVKISELPEATNVNDEDLLMVVQGGYNKKVSKEVLENNLQEQITTNTEDISGLKGEVVYNNVSGSNSDIVIDDITGAAYIDIVYSILYNNEYTYFSKRIYDPVGKKIVLDGMIFLTFEYSNNFAVTYQISATSISHTGTYGYFNRKYPAGTMSGETNNYDVLKINKVVAYY